MIVVSDNFNYVRAIQEKPEKGILLRGFFNICPSNRCKWKGSIGEFNVKLLEFGIRFNIFTRVRVRRSICSEWWMAWMCIHNQGTISWSLICSHCASHSLHFPHIRNTLGTIKELIRFFELSNKRQNIPQNKTQHMDTRLWDKNTAFNKIVWNKVGRKTGCYNLFILILHALGSIQDCAESSKTAFYNNNRLHLRNLYHPISRSVQAKQ